jgi:8-oxo-dGTP pyrophosphatase MutT (NUDIX family)
MRRAEHPRDPWSGHVSLPGGRREPADSGLLATAIRETREEVGLDLVGAPVLGALEVLRTPVPLRRMVIAPFVFALEHAFEPVISAEVVRTFWLPLERVVAGELDSHVEWNAVGMPPRWPAWRHDGEVVWGLTHRILGGLLERLK